MHQPLHLLISSNNSASLERAKLLAENLLDTICAECGASRYACCSEYMKCDCNLLTFHEKKCM